ncbi:MAG TPA: hypothetical protein VIK38_14400 [Coriobacteriia bacterium]
MKRLVSIVTLVVVVLAFSAGPAFTSVCSGSDCGPAMVCEMAATPACPMLNGAPLIHGTCGHPMGGADQDAASVPTGHHEPVLAVAPLAGSTVRLSTAPCAWVLPLADARGAPHLTAVIRI